MRVSEYIVAKMAVTVVAISATAGIVFVTARWIAPWIGRQLATIFPNGVSQLGGVIVGLSIVVFVVLSVKPILGYTLALFDDWVSRNGGIDPTD